MKWLISVGVLVAVYGGAAEARTSEAGKRLYLKDGCFECHGYAGQGGRAHTKLAGTKLSREAFVNFVRNPPPGEMPPYSSKVMSDEGLADIWTYINTFPESRSWKDIPQLRQ